MITKSAAQIRDRLATILLEGPRSAIELFDEVTVWLAGSRDYKLYREAEKTYGNLVRSIMQRSLEEGSVELDAKLKYKWKEGK